MPLNGSGSYSPPAPQFPAIPNTIIKSDDFNKIILDIATALTTAIFRDGQAAFTTNQSMGGNKLTDLANGGNPQDAVTYLQVFTDPTFSTSTATGLKVTGSAVTISVTNCDLSGSTLVKLPANTTIGTVTAAEIARLSGVTSPIQAQLNTKGAIAGQVWTGTHDFSASVVKVPTMVSGTNTTDAASTAFVLQTAMNTALPLQDPSTVGKVPVSDGANASWKAIPANSLYLASNFGGI